MYCTLPSHSRTVETQFIDFILNFLVLIVVRFTLKTYTVFSPAFLSSAVFTTFLIITELLLLSIKIISNQQ